MPCDADVVKNTPCETDGVKPCEADEVTNTPSEDVAGVKKMPCDEAGDGGGGCTRRSGSD